MKLFATLLTLCLAVVVSAQSNAIDAAVDEPSQEYLPPAEEANAAKLAEDGYRYKTVRKLKYRARHRRDVSQEYLPPVNEPNQEYLPPSEEKAETKLADDGYRYRTVHKLKLRSRHRRDVSQEYLPPVNEPTQEYLPPGEEKAEDGYRYKTVRRIRYRHRHRRDVSELVNNDYLPPVAATQQEEVFVEAAPEQTVVVEEAAPIEAASQDSAVLANDGYRYKTLRRIRYRYRRDVSELPLNKYLPPTEAQTQEFISVVPEPEETSVLADDGYRYKAVHRLKHRRH